MRFGRKKQPLRWLVEEHDDGWYVQSYDPQRDPAVAPEGSGPYGGVFGPYETEEKAEQRAVINRAILPTRKSLQLLNQPGAYERRVLALMTREQQEEVRTYLLNRGLEGGDEWVAELIAKSIEGRQGNGIHIYVQEDTMAALSRSPRWVDSHHPIYSVFEIEIGPDGRASGLDQPLCSGLIRSKAIWFHSFPETRPVILEGWKYMLEHNSLTVPYRINAPLGNLVASARDDHRPELMPEPLALRSELERQRPKGQDG